MYLNDEAEHDHVPFRFDGAPGRGHQIVVTAARRRWLAERWAAQWRRPPTTDQLDAMVQDFLREEVFYREALRLSLDHNDLIVRRRLVQKMEALALENDAPIGNAEMMDYFLQHREQYRMPELVTFSHVFFSSAARGDDAQRDAAAAANKSPRSPATEVSDIGDVPIMPNPMVAVTRAAVADHFGNEFAAAVFALERNVWSGPLPSAYGYHLVLVSAHHDARLYELEEVSGRVAADVDAERRLGAIDKLYESLRPTYHVVLEGAGVPEEDVRPPAETVQEMEMKA